MRGHPKRFTPLFFGFVECIKAIRYHQYQDFPDLQNFVRSFIQVAIYVFNTVPLWVAYRVTLYITSTTVDLKIRWLNNNELYLYSARNKSNSSLKLSFHLFLNLVQIHSH